MAADPQRLAEADESEQLYRLIAETIPHIVWTARADGRLDFVNRRCCEYTGLEAVALSGWQWRSVIHPEDRERTLAIWTRVLQTGERFEVEYRLRRGDGAYRWHQGAAMPLRGADGRVLRWFGTCTDIELQMQSARILESARTRAEHALRENEQRFQLFMDNVPGLAWMRDANGRYLYANHRYAAEHGKEPAALVGEPVSRFFPEEVARQFIERDREVQARGQPLQYVDRIPAGHWLKIKFPIPDPAGGVGVAGIAFDITERVRLEEALGESDRRTRALVARLIAARESERRQLADELHDLIGQNLTALGIDLVALAPSLAAQGDAAGARRLAAMRALVEGTVDAIRGLMTGLRPPALEEFGLEPALRSHAAELAQRTGLAVEVQVEGAAPRLERAVEIALFRIAQEALTNAAKHSGSAAVRVQLATRGRRVQLSVEDDGRGFGDRQPARDARAGGWGLQEMRERAEAHGGTLHIDTSARGTRVTVEVPR
jgi:PAS domain S-box-containing protein